MTLPSLALLPPTPVETRQYQNRKRVCHVLLIGLSLVILTGAALAMGPSVDGYVSPWVGTNPWLRLVALGVLYGALVEALTLPVTFYSSFLLEHRHGLSTQSLPRWIWHLLKGYGLGAPLGLGALVGLYAFLWYTGEAWWIWATLGGLVVSLGLGWLFPVLLLPLFYRVTPLEDVALRQRFERLCQGAGVALQGVFRFDLSGVTRKANAALTGFGRTRRVLLGDTLLQAFTPDEIEIILAHELGHHVYGHMVRGLALSMGLMGLSFFVVDQGLRCAAPSLGYASYDDPAALPLLLLMFFLVQLVLTPIQNAISRHHERQCDRYALDRTGLVDAYRSAFVKLAALNKSDTDPHPLVVLLFEDHPPIRERLALADSPTSLS